MRLLLLLPLLLAACTTPGYRGLWEPKPAEMRVTGADGETAVRLTVAVLGEWYGGHEDGQMGVRFRIENVGSETARLLLPRCEMFSGDLLNLGQPWMTGGDDAAVPPGGASIVDVSFSPPVEDTDMRGLQVRWVLLVGEREVPGALTFSLTEPIYVPYYGSVGVGVGYGYCSDDFRVGYHDHYHW